MHGHQAFHWIWVKIVPVLATGAVVTASLLYAAGPATPEPGLTEASKSKIDPVEANGKIFEGWPKPDLALVFTGAMSGYLEPCGCAGLENQKGGLKRRFTMLDQLRKQNGWSVIAMDGGTQEKDVTVQADMKVEFAYQALISMGYQVVGLGENDLKHELPSIVINFDDNKNPLVSANVETGFSKPFKVITAGGMKIGVTSVLGAKEVARLGNMKDYKLSLPVQAIPMVVPELLKAKCDHLVLLVNGSPGEAKELAVNYKDFGFDWILTTQGAEVPPKEPDKIQGTDAHLIEIGEKGEYAVVVGLYKNGSPSFRYQRVPLDHRFSDAEEITKRQVEYQRSLQNLDLDGLKLKPVPHPSGRKFAGTKTCDDCHTHAAEVFNKTPHASATETLVKRSSPPRIYDPECLSCHVTGWEPQKRLPFETGYRNLRDTPDLVGNGCENCHGPAARHAAVENGKINVADAERKQLQQQLRLTVVKNEGNKKDQIYKEGGVVDMCMRCHDIDNSPDFDFQKYWPKVQHVGKN